MKASTICFEQAEIAGTVRSIRVDIRDFATLKTAIADCHPEVVIHMAAQAVFRRGYDDPIEPIRRMSWEPCLSWRRGVSYDSLALRPILQVTSAMRIVRGCGDIARMGQWAARIHAQAPRVVRNSRSKPIENHSSHPSGSTVTASPSPARAGIVIGGGDWSKDRLIPDLMRLSWRAKPA